MTERKKGRFTLEEIAVIEQDCESLDAQVIAYKLNRDPQSVRDFIKVKLGKGQTEKENFQLTASYDLTKRPVWKEIKKQFHEDELDYFKYQWGQIISQFRDDVQPTEEMQIIDAIRLEILMNRCLEHKMRTEVDIKENQLNITNERKLGDAQDVNLIIAYERNIASLTAGMDSLGKDFKEMQTKKNAILKDLKATREQRVERLEDAKENFVAWLKRLDSDPAFTRQMGIDMEKMRMAVEIEQERLTQYHTYENKVVDQPFLSPESILDDHI